VDGIVTHSSCHGILSKEGKFLSGIFGLAIVTLNSHALHTKVTKSTVDAKLTKSLHSADLLIGIYFGGLSVAGAYMGEAYIINHLWWLNSDICRLLAFISTTSIIVSALQEVVICLERLSNIAFLEKRLWPGKRGTSLTILLVWAAGVLVSASFVFGVGLSNRICLPLNFFEDRLTRWYVVGVVLFILNLSGFVVMFWSALKIHRKVLESTTELQKISENKISLNKAYKTRLALMLLAFFLNKLCIDVLVVMPSMGVVLGPDKQMLLFAPCLGARPILNPFLYTWRKFKPNK
jgi:hypothetical protein